MCRLPLMMIALVNVLAATFSYAGEVAPRPSAGCSTATIETGERLERTIEIDGVKRSYILDVPSRVQAHVAAPLLFDFHGLGHSGGGVWNVSGFRDIAKQEAFITVYPDGLPVVLRRDEKKFEGTGWEIGSVDGNRDLKFTTRLLDLIEQTYCIDRARVYATGFSNGAYFSHLLGCVMSDRIAAIAPVSGGRIPIECKPSRGVPVLIHHGRQDERIPLADAHKARDAWIELNQCRDHSSNGCEWHRECRDGAVVEYCEGDFMHRWPQEATARIWEFFKQHPMKQ